MISGPGEVKAEKMLHFGEEKPSDSDMSYKLAAGLASRIWKDEDQEFKPISSNEDINELHYVYSHQSSSGYAIVIFRNRSFKKNYYVDFPNLNFSKKTAYPYSI